MNGGGEREGNRSTLYRLFTRILSAFLDIGTNDTLPDSISGISQSREDTRTSILPNAFSLRRIGEGVSLALKTITEPMSILNSQIYSVRVPAIDQMLGTIVRAFGGEENILLEYY